MTTKGFCGVFLQKLNSDGWFWIRINSCVIKAGCCLSTQLITESRTVFPLLGLWQVSDRAALCLSTDIVTGLSKEV